MKISPAQINSLLYTEKAAIFTVILATSESVFLFRGECVASTTGDTGGCSLIKKTQYISFFNNISFE